MTNRVLRSPARLSPWARGGGSARGSAAGTHTHTLEVNQPHPRAPDTRLTCSGSGGQGAHPECAAGGLGRTRLSGALLQSPPGHGSPRQSAASAPLTPSPRISLSLPRSSRRQRRKQSRFLKSWGREDFRAMGGRERRANRGTEAGKAGHRRQSADPDGRSWWEHMLRPQRSPVLRSPERFPTRCSRAP